ncbi:MAG: EVE domain-containing protein, partial [Dehalococcoidia bacterium]
MGNHIFLASQANFEKCLRYGVYGGISHSFERTNSEIIAGFEAIKPGDFVFFYVKNVGLYGLWKIISRPFFDDVDIWGAKNQLYPYRVCFQPTIRNFPKPIALSDILDLRDKGKIWAFDLGTFAKKSHQPITSEEGKELIRLLLRNNPIFYEVTEISEPYSEAHVPLPLMFETDDKGQIKIEGYLNAWFMRSFAQDELKDVIGEYHDFLNYVPTSFNTVMDIFLTHITTVDSVDILHKFTCIELKTGVCTENDL